VCGGSPYTEHKKSCSTHLDSISLCSFLVLPECPFVAVTKVRFTVLKCPTPGGPYGCTQKPRQRPTVSPSRTLSTRACFGPCMTLLTRRAARDVRSIHAWSDQRHNACSTIVKDVHSQSIFTGHNRHRHSEVPTLKQSARDLLATTPLRSGNKGPHGRKNVGSAPESGHIDNAYISVWCTSGNDRGCVKTKSDFQEWEINTTIGTILPCCSKCGGHINSIIV
jgi:hypothetical protein